MSGESDRMRRTTVVRPNVRIAYQELMDGAGGVVLHLETAQYHGMNPIGALVWSLLGDGTTFGALVDAVSERVKDAPPDLGDDVAAFLLQLEARDLVTLEDGEGDG